jgi:hypothetical protein
MFCPVNICMEESDRTPAAASIPIITSGVAHELQNESEHEKDPLNSSRAYVNHMKTRLRGNQMSQQQAESVVLALTSILMRRRKETLAHLVTCSEATGMLSSSNFAVDKIPDARFATKVH